MTLTGLFDKERDILQQRIDDDPLPDTAIKATRECLDTVHYAYRDGQEADPLKRQLAAALIELIKTAISAQPDTYTAQVWYRNQPTPTATAKRGFSFWRWLQVILVLGLGTSLYVYHLYPYLYSLAALTLMEIVRIGSAYRDVVASKAVGSPSIDVKARVEVDAERLIIHLNQMMIVADKIVLETAAAVDQVQQEHGPKLNAALLDFYQDLLEAAQFNDGDFALKRIRVLPQLLREEGIGVMDYAEPSQKRFDSVPSLSSGITALRTLRPALVKGEVTLRRGLVEIPQEDRAGQAELREVH